MKLDLEDSLFRQIVDEYDIVSYIYHEKRFIFFNKEGCPRAEFFPSRVTHDGLVTQGGFFDYSKILK